MIAEPPFDAGAVQVTVACAFPGVAITFVGAPEGPAGDTEVEALDATLLPIAFSALTVKVYPVPFVRPVTVHELPCVALQVNPPGEEVTV